ncbi:3-oxo-5-alpha-steroid 4-dehydrogenase family protein [Tritrichomonas foetus]|uniref:3-oxo-5-alpha-steroid 4-dehydrogenase family protein n=1 Tax=Tritrichomonas foetus TaxID=1144522 RepID=A0A1J4KPQ7_9EUKA|nr:3-oxo-5-alpha-steroid 4-dehydrogenase family protein [Tritrichomonas foetus]|eukprot:OHT12880.1 3-oxo-5-alpha-steroid 4-dehydrogenase family protein [Tritrichomonas foetus]
MLTNFFDALQSEEGFNSFIQTSMIIVGGLIITHHILPFQYGKSYTRGKSILHFEVPDKIAVILVHMSGPSIFLYLFYKYDENLLSTPSILYLIHYTHRVVIYPWFRSRHSRPWPLESILFFSSTNFVAGLILAHSIISKLQTRTIILQVLLSLIFLACAFLAGYHDYYLCSLRQVGESGYRIPSWICFNWVSCPHYTFELIEWFFFGFFIKMNERILFWLIEFLNLSIRASSSTAAYHKLFLSKYPKRKNLILPIFYSPVSM